MKNHLILTSIIRICDILKPAKAVHITYDDVQKKSDYGYDEYNYNYENFKIQPKMFVNYGDIAKKSKQEKSEKSDKKVQTQPAVIFFNETIATTAATTILGKMSTTTAFDFYKYGDYGEDYWGGLEGGDVIEDTNTASTTASTTERSTTTTDDYEYDEYDYEEDQESSSTEVTTTTLETTGGGSHLIQEQIVGPFGVIFKCVT